MPNIKLDASVTSAEATEITRRLLLEIKDQFDQACAAFVEGDANAYKRSIFRVWMKANDARQVGRVAFLDAAPDATARAIEFVESRPLNVQERKWPSKIRQLDPRLATADVITALVGLQQDGMVSLEKTDTGAWIWTRKA